MTQYYWIKSVTANI